MIDRRTFVMAGLATATAPNFASSQTLGVTDKAINIDSTCAYSGPAASQRAGTPMRTARVNGIDICYETTGNPTDTPLLLVHGYGAQLIQWPDGFCDALAKRGLFVIRFDNRDVGLTTKFHGQIPVLVPAKPGGYPTVAGRPPYSLRDMAMDGIELFQSLGYKRAHVAGASLGGGVVQRMAIDFPETLLSMTSIMARPGPAAGNPKPEATAALLAPAPAGRDDYIEHLVKVTRVLYGTYYDAQTVRQAAVARYDRCFYPEGMRRQLAAYIDDGDRTEGLKTVRTPTLVVHGRDDPLATLSGGEAVAAAVPGAKLKVFDGMGHDLPEPLWGDIAQAIADHVRSV